MSQRLYGETVKTQRTHAAESSRSASPAASTSKLPPGHAEVEEKRRVVDVEIVIRAKDSRTYTADVVMRLPDSQDERRLATDAQLIFDLISLRAAYLDVPAYEKQLTDALFREEQMRNAWRTASDFAAGWEALIRLRLRLEPSADSLQHLRWELLLNPSVNVSHSMAKSRQVLLSRYIATEDLWRTQLPMLSEVTALVAIANPTDLNQFKLAPISVPEELDRTDRDLKDFKRTILARSGDGHAVTQEALFTALNNGCHILYVIAHSQIRHGDAYLWLEAKDGSTAMLSGNALVEHIAGLESALRPLLIVLASCASAGTNYDDDVVAALGPRLARAGVGAVLGFQGAVPVKMVAQFMPRFFARLCANGEVDRAVAIARTELSDEQPWWMPVLFLRLRDGRLWRLAEPHTHVEIDQSQISRVADQIAPPLEQPKSETSVSQKPTSTLAPVLALGIALTTLIVATLWLVILPGFEPLLTVIGAAGAVIGMLAFRKQRSWATIAAILGAGIIIAGGYIWLRSPDLHPAPKTTAVFRIAKQNGDPIGGAHIIAITGNEKHATVSDSFGLGQIDAVPQVPSAELMVLAEGYESHNEAIDLTRPGPWPIVLTPRDSNKRGVLIRVVEAARFVPVQNAEVTLIVGSTPYSGVTDKNGIAHFDLPFNAQTLLADLNVSAEGRKTSNQLVTLQPDTLQDVRLDTERHEITVGTP